MVAVMLGSDLSITQLRQSVNRICSEYDRVNGDFGLWPLD